METYGFGLFGQKGANYSQYERQYEEEVDESGRGNGSFRSCLSNNKGKVILGIVGIVALVWILHATGALSAPEHFLSEKVFTPIGDFFSEHKDVILTKVIPAIAGTAVALGAGIYIFKKTKQYVERKIEQGANERVQQSLQSGEARRVINQQVSEERRRLQEQLPAIVERKKQEEQQQAIQKEKESLVGFVSGNFVEPYMQEQQRELDRKRQELQSVGTRTREVAQPQYMSTFASMMHERNPNYDYEVTVEYYGPNPQNLDGDWILVKEKMWKSKYDELVANYQGQGRFQVVE